MSLWKIAWRSIQQRALASTLTGFSMALGVALVVVVLVIHGVVERHFRQGAQGYHLIVGAKGGKLQLVLNTVYHLSQPIENIPYSYYKEFVDGQFASMTLVAVPYCLGDSYVAGDETFRVVGTTPDLFDKIEYGRTEQGEPMRYEFEPGGRNFVSQHFFEGVIGSVVTAKTGLKVGDTFQPSHDIVEEGEEGHKHDAFKVVGVLEPTGTPNDRALFINIEGFYLLEGHAKSHAQSAAQKTGPQPVAQTFLSVQAAGDGDVSTASPRISLASNPTPKQALSPALSQREREMLVAQTFLSVQEGGDADSLTTPPRISLASSPTTPHALSPALSQRERAMLVAQTFLSVQEGGDADSLTTPPRISLASSPTTPHALSPALSQRERELIAQADPAEHAEHDHAGHDHADHAHAHDHAHHEPLPEAQREVTSILVLASFEGMQQFIYNMVNEGQVAQAVYPSREVENLFAGIVGPLRLILLVLTVMIVVVSGVGILVSIYNSMSERRRDIAVMRALGARRGMVMSVIMMESLLISLAGGIAGVALGHAAIGLVNPFVVEQTGVSLGFLRFDVQELILIPGLMILATLAGFLPAMAAYRTDVARSLGGTP
ncbi:MAG: FtsX-like permease family protein [Pirellulales bacterium]